MARFLPLFSSSSANCCFVGTGNNGILVDAGASGKQIITALAEKGIEPQNIKAIFVTHEHSDHIKGLSAVIRKIKAPVIASADTLAAIEKYCKLPSDAVLTEINGQMVFEDFAVNRFETSHDCVGSSGYSFNLADDTKISVCTDLGVVTNGVRDALLGSNLVYIESNHDIKMLKSGPYPPELKLRILSDKGHLSNISCSAELPALLKSGTTRFVLAHLSQQNNLPKLAESAAVASLGDIGAARNTDYILSTAKVSGGDWFCL